MLYCF